MDMVLNLAVAAFPATESSAVEKPNADSKATEPGKQEGAQANAAMDWAAIFNATLSSATAANSAAASGDAASVGKDASKESATEAVLSAASPLDILKNAQAAGAQALQGGASAGLFADVLNPAEQAVSTGKDLLAGVLQQAKLNKDIQSFQISTKAVPVAAESTASIDVGDLKEQLAQVKGLSAEKSASKKADEALSKHRQARGELSASAERLVEEAGEAKKSDKETVLFKEKALETNSGKSERVQGLEASLSSGYESAFSKFDAEVKADQTAQASVPVEDPAWVDSMRQQMDLAKLKNSDVLRVDVTLRDDQKLGLEANIKDGVLLVRFDSQSNMKELLGANELENIMSVMLESAPEVKEVRFEQKSDFGNSQGGSSAFASSEQNNGRSSQGGRGQDTDRPGYTNTAKGGVEVLNTPISSVRNAFAEGRTSWRA